MRRARVYHPRALLWGLSLTAAVCCFTSGGPVRAEPEAPSQCEQAGAAAEQTYGLPPGLLLAIGRVESGRWDPAKSRVIPWPWTINAAGRGQWFDTPADAIQTVRTLLDAGTQSIDAGCFQISLLWHPMAFASLEQAFDPLANAAYAARFLVSLYGRLGTWDAAVEAYHSADPARGLAYRQQVFSTWSTPPAMQPAASPAVEPPPEVIPAVIAGVQVWTPARPGTAPNSIAIPVPSALLAIGKDPPPVPDPLPLVIPHRFTPGG